jgi:hypothetical protein
MPVHPADRPDCDRLQHWRYEAQNPLTLQGIPGQAEARQVFLEAVGIVRLALGIA